MAEFSTDNKKILIDLVQRASDRGFYIISTFNLAGITASIAFITFFTKQQMPITASGFLLLKLAGTFFFAGALFSALLGVEYFNIKKITLSLLVKKQSKFRASCLGELFEILGVLSGVCLFCGLALLLAFLWYI